MKPDEITVGMPVRLYRRAHDKYESILEVTEFWYVDELDGWCVRLSDGFVINIEKGIRPVKTKAHLNRRFVYVFFFFIAELTGIVLFSRVLVLGFDLFALIALVSNVIFAVISYINIRKLI